MCSPSPRCVFQCSEKGCVFKYAFQSSNGFAQEWKQTEDLTNGHSTHTPVTPLSLTHWTEMICACVCGFISELYCSDLPQMCNGIQENGGINGSSYLKSVPVSERERRSSRIKLRVCVCVCLFSVLSVCDVCFQISALKQNGLLQSLATGGDQTEADGKINMFILYKTM